MNNEQWKKRGMEVAVGSGSRQGKTNVMIKL
jgi:hypothetical protein